MANYGTAPPPPAPAPDVFEAAAAPEAKSPRRRRALLAGLAVAAAALLALSSRAGALLDRVQTPAVLAAARGRVRAPRVASGDGALTRLAPDDFLRDVARAGGMHGCKRFRPFGRFGGPDAEVVRRVFESTGRAVVHDGKSASDGDDGHDDDHHHHHHHHHHGWWHRHDRHGHHHHGHHGHHGHSHGRGWRAFFSGALGHPPSPHSFNYACNMPVLTPCLSTCRARPKTEKPRWPCLMHCARSNCFVIGASCGQAAFDTCAAKCKSLGTGDKFVACAKTCFADICPVKKA